MPRLNEQQLMNKVQVNLKAINAKYIVFIRSSFDKVNESHRWQQEKNMHKNLCFSHLKALVNNWGNADEQCLPCSHSNLSRTLWTTW